MRLLHWLGRGRWCRYGPLLGMMTLDDGVVLAKQECLGCGDVWYTAGKKFGPGCFEGRGRARMVRGFVFVADPETVPGF